MYISELKKLFFLGSLYWGGGDFITNIKRFNVLLFIWQESKTRTKVLNNFVLSSTYEGRGRKIFSSLLFIIQFLIMNEFFEKRWYFIEIWGGEKHVRHLLKVKVLITFSFRRLFFRRNGKNYLEGVWEEYFRQIWYRLWDFFPIEWHLEDMEGYRAGE